MRIRVVWGVLAFLLPGLAGAGIYEDAGTASATFLVMGGGARLLGMGGAGVADQRGPNAIYTNSAQLALEESAGGSFTHGVYLEGTTLEQLAISVPGPVGNFGVALSAMRVGEIDSYDIVGTKTGTFSPWDLSLSAAYACPLGPVALGGVLSYLQSELGPGSRARGICADAGVSASPLPDVRMGISLQHMGTPLKYDREAEPLPLTIRAGASYLLKTADIVFATDIVKAKDESAAIRLGANKAAQLAESLGLDLRAGWRSGAFGGEFAGFSLGGGISWSIREDFMNWPSSVNALGERKPAGQHISRLCVDYAWTPLGELGQAHWLSFGLMF